MAPWKTWCEVLGGRLPYVVPSLNRWKRSLLRERDLTDLAAQDP